MIKQYIVDILIRKIKSGEINPITNQPFKIEDVKLEEYKIVVNEELKK